LGVIAGDTNINPVNWFLMEGPNDSIVSVESTRVAGMAAHKVLPVTHSFMMRNNEVIDNTIHFLKTGSFIPE
ncbi:MAG: alpha/beta hydrolase, partial [Gammaproteobacteria bacterium]|nr:alpha/beta hydrolase [Gammaproteobacteria bacterium]